MSEVSEVQRREVIVNRKGINFAGIGNGVLEISIASNGPKKFLLSLRDTVVAESDSDHALSIWAFKQNGVTDVKHNYKLSLGDDGR